MDDFLLPPLRGERLLIRPARPEDAEAMRALIREPEVAPWWGTSEDLAREVEWMVRQHVIEIDGEVAGWLGVQAEDEPDYRQAGLDIALTTSRHDQGYGREALQLAIRHLIDVEGHHRLTIDPAAANGRAIRAYAAVGFRPVGVMRKYERSADGEWRDALLMDLLAEEFDSSPSATSSKPG
jgi:aminoglycoside 6'-N-acetyltransferase